MLLPAGAARATGACENTEIRYFPPSRFSPAAHQFAFEGTSDWCEEKDDGSVVEEVRGTISFVEIRDAAGKVVTRLSGVRGRNAGRLRDAVGPFEEIAAPKVASTLASRGFVPLAATARSPAGDCRVRTRYAAQKEKQNGFPAGSVVVEVRAGKRTLLARDVGVAARELRVDIAVRAQFLPAERAVAVWVRVPQCTGGPPPGYWGEGSPGECYHADTIAIALLTAVDQPELEACLVEAQP
jgi:hypothetical protein